MDKFGQSKHSTFDNYYGPKTVSVPKISSKNQPREVEKKNYQ